MANFTDRVLNRKPRKYDHRDLRMSDFITQEMRDRAAAVTSNDWAVDHILDQGQTPHCVGFAWAGFGISQPVVDNWDDGMGNKIYYQAKIEDGEPGQEDGSDTLSGVKAFMHFGKLSGDGYAFAASVADIQTWVLTTSPVIVGTNWYDSMFTPNSKGVVKISGSVAGGHEWMISGYDKTTDLFHCTNSWGDSFGIGGQFYISTKDLTRLMNEQGDACTTVEISSAPVPPVPPTPPNPPTPYPNWFVAFIQAVIKFLQSLLGN